MKKLILALAWCLISPGVHAQDPLPVSIIGMEFEGTIQRDQHGAFDYMLADFRQQIAIPMHYEVVVPARGYRLFFNHKVNCILPSVDYPPYFKGLDMIHTQSFARVNHMGFVLEGEAITRHAQLSGKVVGIIRDEGTWDYTQRVQADNISWVQVDDLATLVNVLYNGRIEIAIHDKEDFLNAVHKRGLDEPTYSPKHPLWTDNVILSCHKNAQNQKLIDALNPLITKLNAQNGLRDYYARAMAQQ